MPFSKLDSVPEEKPPNELDLIEMAVCSDQKFFRGLIRQGRVNDAMAIIGAMIGKNGESI